MDLRSSKVITILRPPTLPLLLALLALACGPPTPLSPPDDLLIIAAASERGVLIPIARYADGVWDRAPWVGKVDMDRLTASPAGETSWQWPDGRRTWHHPGRAWDTIGQPGHAVATGVPDTWHLFSDTGPAPPLTTLGLSIVTEICYVGEGPSRERRKGISWAVRTRDPERPAYVRGLVGLALSRTPASVLTVRQREACSSEPVPASEAASPVAGDTPSPGSGALWIAVAYRDQATLMPVVRYLDGSWDNPPWAGVFPVERIAAARTGEGVWSWPDASVLWEHPARHSDTLGRAPEVVATEVPASWFLYSRTERRLPLYTTGLGVVPAGCNERWDIGTNRDTLPAFGDDRFSRLSGIAFTHPPSAVLSEGDIPALDWIREDLGFVDSPRDGEGYRRFHWLGLFRFDDGPLGAATLGVLRGDYYEGRGYMVIQIDGDRGRVIARASEGGC